MHVRGRIWHALAHQRVPYLPPSSLFPMAMRASRSVPFRPYCSSSLAASTFSGTRSTHSCSTHERLQILLWERKRGERVGIGFRRNDVIE